MIRVVKALMGCVLVATVFQLFAPLFLSSASIHKISDAEYNVYPAHLNVSFLLKEEKEVTYEKAEHSKAMLLLDLACHCLNLKSFHRIHSFSFLNHRQESQPPLFTRYRTFLI